MSPFMMARRQVLIGLGGYRPGFHSFAEDTDLCWRLQEIGRLNAVAKILGDYRYNPQSISSQTILNGRLLALYSQLAAVSALRRRTGQSDIDFDALSLAELKTARSTSRMLEIAGPNLTELEKSYLRKAVAAKLLEITSYRPYELDLEDCRFISEALRTSEKSMTSQNLNQIRRSRSIASARLLRAGRPKSAYIVMGDGTILHSILYFILQTFEWVLPAAARRSFRNSRARRKLSGIELSSSV